MTRILALLAAVLLAGPSLAHDFKVGDLEIIHPNIPQPFASARSAGGYLSIINEGTEPDRLIAVESDMAASAMLHESKVDDSGVATMEHLEAIEIPPGETVEFSNGRYHIMFMGLQGKLTEGEMHKATLVFEKAGRLEVEFKVEPPLATGEGMDHSTLDHSKMDHGSKGHDAHAAQGDHTAMPPVMMTGDAMVDIEALLKAEFDTPENLLTVAPITVHGDVAIAGWSQNGMGGRAFLRKDADGWFVEVCAGRGLLMPEMLAALGLPEADAGALLASVNAAEGTLDAETIALFDSFDGELFIGREGHQHGAATN